MITEFDKDILAGTEKKTVKRYFLTGFLKGMTIRQTVDKNRRLGLFLSFTNTWYIDF